MKVQQKLEQFKKEIDEILYLAKQKNNERLDWCESNRKDIKNLYPKINQVYELINIEESGLCEYWINENMQNYGINGGINGIEKYYFKPDYINCNIKSDFRCTRSKGVPTVKGVVYDCNLKGVGHFYEERWNYKGHFETHYVNVFCLKEINLDNVPSKSSDMLTKVYLMIDKNTGYYKIGRSKNPKYREGTLQSKKPTVELLFSYDALVKQEKELHNMFSEKRIRGEWFDLRGSDIDNIKKYFNDKGQVSGDYKHE